MRLRWCFNRGCREVYMFPLISVIIPIYNTAPWLRRCLDSVCGQTLENIEIICVNDGSSDESGNILMEYATRDDRLLPITLGHNRGVSTARNLGIGASRGKWLSFVDSDDALERDFYEKLYRASLDDNAEIIKGACWVEDKFHNNKILCDEYIKEDKFNFTEKWFSAIYRSKFIKENNIHFPQICSNNEDVVFLFCALLNAKGVHVVSDAIYKNYFRKWSLSNSPLTLKQADSIISARGIMIDMLDHSTIDDLKYISLFLRNMYYCCAFSERVIEEDKFKVIMLTANALYEFYNRCKKPMLLLHELNKKGDKLGVLLERGDIKGLVEWLSISTLQRLRTKVVSRLKKY